MTHDDYLAHHKYVSKVGGPGHWKYIYTTQSNGVGLDGAGPNVSRSTTYHTPLANVTKTDTKSVLSGRTSTGFKVSPGAVTNPNNVDKTISRYSNVAGKKLSEINKTISRYSKVAGKKLSEINKTKGTIQKAAGKKLSEINRSINSLGVPKKYKKFKDGITKIDDNHGALKTKNGHTHDVEWKTTLGNSTSRVSKPKLSNTKNNKNSGYIKNQDSSTYNTKLKTTLENSTAPNYSGKDKKKKGHK